MLELLQESIAPVNLPYTFLLGLAVLYWAMYLLGAIGSDALDFLGLDLDVDADVDVGGDIDGDVDVDVDADLDADGGTAGSGGFFLSILRFFHVGELPVLLIASIQFLGMWIFSLLANEMLNSQSSGLIALALFPLIFFGGLFFTKAIIMPFAPYLKTIFDEKGERVEVMGKTCRVISLEVTPDYGQAEFGEDPMSLLLNVRTKPGTTLHKGDEAVIFDHDQEKDTYLVAKFDINTPVDQET